MYLQKSSGVRRLTRRDFFGRPGHHDLAAWPPSGPRSITWSAVLITSRWVLDQQHRVPGIHQAIQGLQQPLDVREVALRRRPVVIPEHLAMAPMAAVSSNGL